MAVSKNNRGARDTSKSNTYKVKWVKKANMWCETIVENGKQTQNFTTEKPTLRTDATN